MFFDGSGADFKLFALVDFAFLELGELNVEAIDFRVDLVEAVIESCFNLVDLGVEFSDIFSKSSEAAFHGIGKSRDLRCSFLCRHIKRQYTTAVQRRVVGGFRRTTQITKIEKGGVRMRTEIGNDTRAFWTPCWSRILGGAATAEGLY